MADQLDEHLLNFFAKLRLRDALREEEQQAIVDAARERITFKAGEDLVREGERPHRSMLLVKGFSSRYRLQSDGARQITALHIGGDFVDLHSFLLKEMDHSVGALTDCEVITFPHDRLVSLTEHFPHLTRMLWLMTLVDASMHREWLVGLGLLSATERAAHLFCEMYRRLETVGQASGNTFRFPITQATMADALGISSVHVNRVIQELRQRQLISWEGGVVTIFDWNALAAAGHFDERYLHLVTELR